MIISMKSLLIYIKVNRLLTIKINCGVFMSIICPECKKENDDGAEFCKNCGKEI